MRVRSPATDRAQPQPRVDLPKLVNLPGHQRRRRGDRNVWASGKLDCIACHACAVIMTKEDGLISWDVARVAARLKHETKVVSIQGETLEFRQIVRG